MYVWRECQGVLPTKLGQNLLNGTFKKENGEQHAFEAILVRLFLEIKFAKLKFQPKIDFTKLKNQLV